MLKSYGVDVGATMVLDPQNEPFPVQQQRTVGGMQVNEIQQVPYPYFVDVRSDGMGKGSSITANLPAVSLQWSSPITLPEELNTGREVTILARSTEGSWLSSATDVTPDTDTYPPYGFPVQGEPRSYPLAVALRGSFQSYFKDKTSPFEPGSGVSVTQTLTSTFGTVESSPGTARLVVIGSNEFVDDPVLQLAQGVSGERYLYNLQLVQNAVDWAVEDEDLLTIRSRGTYARLLNPVTPGKESLWEGLNYGLALLALIGIGVVWTLRRRSEQPMALVEGEDRARDGESLGNEEG